MNEPTIKIGFWRDPDDPDTAGLPDPRECVDEAWESTERATAIEYLKSGTYGLPAVGYSWCRFKCGIPQREMGCCDVSDGVFVWPQGLVHYLEVHYVKPPGEFLQHVRAKLREQSARDSHHK